MTQRVLADTNVLVSALRSPGSVSDQALQRILERDRLVLTGWILTEFIEVIGRKWPERTAVARLLLDGLDFDLVDPAATELVIADPDDQPILDAAVVNGVDIIVTGDRHFHELGLVRPLVLTPRAYLDLE